MQSWDLIQALLALHRAGTFEAAAQTLGVDSSTLRRRIQALERDIGVPLFRRSDGQLVLADRQKPLLAAALQMEAAYNQFIAQGNKSRSGGTIRVTTLDILANLLTPDFARLRRAHPEIQLELTTEPHFVDLEREQIDIAIRLARPLQGTHGLKRLGTVQFGIYGATEYLSAFREAPPDLLSLYAHRGRMDHEFQLADERWHQDVRNGVVVARADGYPTLLRMCEEGMGLAMLPCMLGDPSPLLQRYAAARRTIQIGVWAVIRRDVRALPKMRLLIAFLSETFLAHAGLLMGTEHKQHGQPAPAATVRNSAKCIRTAPA